MDTSIHHCPPDVQPLPKDPSLAAERDRFTGYNLPTMLLDGFEYYVVDVHPYFHNQPMIYQTPAFAVGFNTAGGDHTPYYSYPLVPSDFPEIPI